jgi:hypothetical protein
MSQATTDTSTRAENPSRFLTSAAKRGASIFKMRARTASADEGEGGG